MALIEKQLLDKNEMLELECQLEQGASQRASTLSLVLGVAFAVYSFTSFQFIHSFDSSITLFSNTWPRLVFNSLPFMMLFFYLKRTDFKGAQRLWIWTIALPVIFMSACMIHIWPLIWRGNLEIYLYVHAANAFIITMSLVLVSPPMKYVMAQVGLFLLSTILPLLAMIYVLDPSKNIFNLFINDFSIIITVLIISAYQFQKVRRKLAIQEKIREKHATMFMGKTLGNAVFQDREQLLDNQMIEAVLLKLDIRNSTEWVKNNEEEVVVNFLSEYSGIVSKIANKTKGYWNKSIGDGHLLSYGALDRSDGLLGVPGIQTEMNAAIKRKREVCFNRALDAVFQIVQMFEILKEKYDCKEEMFLGLAIDCGTVSIKIQGDEDHRKELEIVGKALYRLARLEEFTKAILNTTAEKKSIVLVAPTLKDFASDRIFTCLDLNLQNNFIRDFPEIKTVYYHIFRLDEERRKEILKRRAG